MSNSRINQLLEMLKTEPHDSFLNYGLALEYSKLNSIHKAIEIIEALLLRDENYLGAYYQLGKLCEQLQNNEKAIVIYKKGISIAQQKKNKKTEGELNEALWMLED